MPRVRALLQKYLRLRGDDPWLIGAVAVLCLLGTISAFGTGSFRPEAQGDSLGQWYLLVKHLVRLVLGVGVLVFLAGFDHEILRRPAVCWSALVAGLVLTAIPVFGKHAGIDRWITLFGLFPVQPLEVAKIAVVLYMASRLSVRSMQRPLALRNLATTLALGPGLLMLILVLQPNFGNVVVVGLTTLLLLMLAGLAWRWIGLVAPLTATAGLVGYLFVSKLQTRIDAWRLGWQGQGVGAEPPFGYQVHQSLVGLGAGGWRGLGPGKGHNKFAFLPEQHTDFAFSYLGEELGLIGTGLVVLALLVFAWRGLNVAERAQDNFGRLTAAGLTGMIAIYGFANIAMVCGVIPVMGVPLPFVSYGGSALVSNLAAVGIILSIDRRGRNYQLWRRKWLPERP
jgi:cell division protein FtsW (lipid II flippase)